MQTCDLIIKNGTLVQHTGMEVGNIAIHDGKIAALGDTSNYASSRTIDAGRLHVLPGVIDSHVHFREPGNEHKENFVTGSLAAILGGVTTIFDMPNTLPPTTTLETLCDKIGAASGRMHCDFAFYFGANTNNIALLNQAETTRGVVGIKVFLGPTTDSLHVSPSTLEIILKHTSRRIAIHSECGDRILAREYLRRYNDPTSHAEWRDAIAAETSTRQVIEIATRLQRNVHILHVTSSNEVPLIEGCDDMLVTSEVTPHHLTFDTTSQANQGTYLQVNPPIRSRDHRDCLFQALRDGIITTIGSDHAPHTREEKSCHYPNSPSGVPGVQTLVSVMLDHIHKKRLKLQDFVRLTSYGPHIVFGIKNKGRMVCGYDADFTIVDMKKEREIENSWIASRARWTPYAGMKTTGAPVGTMIRGRLVMWNDEITAPPQGTLVQFTS